MVQPVIKNPEFDEVGINPGDANDWSVSYFTTGQGRGNLGKGESLQPQDKFRWFDKFATLIGANDGPFALSNREFDISDFDHTERRFTIGNVDLRQILPPESFIFIFTTSGNDTFGGFHKVDTVTLSGGNTNIFVADDLDYTSPTTARIVIPPIIFCDVDGYGWSATVADAMPYPIGGSGVPAGFTVYVTVDRGERQPIVFPGGEKTASEIAAVFDSQMTGAIAQEESGQVVWYTESRGRNSKLIVEWPSVEEVEFSGRGQFVQLWTGFFDDMDVATSYELGAVFALYLQHCRVSVKETADGGWVKVTSEHQGEGSKLQIAGPKGVLFSTFDFPISPRVAGVDDELDFRLNNGPFVTVTLTEGATDADVFATDIKRALTALDPSVEVVVSGGRIYVEVYGEIECTGGSARSDLEFVASLVVYGDKVGLDIGFSGKEVYGSDGEHYPTFEDLVSILALFGGDGEFEQFDWGNHFDTIEEAGVQVGEILNWLVEASIGTIDTVDQGEKKVSLLSAHGDRTFAYRPGSKAIVDGSPGNDDVYTVELSSFEGGVTHVFFAEQLPSGTGGGILKPETWVVDGETFENGWGGGIEEGWRSPRVVDGRLFGEPISFPLRIQGNRNVLWLCPEASEMNSLQVTEGEYDTPGDLVAELNTQLVAASISTMFTFDYVGAPEGMYRLIFGFGVGVDFDRHSCFFATVSGKQRGKDVRPTIGFSNLSPNGTERLIVYPKSLFNAVNGTPVSGELTDEDSFWVDPYSFVVWTLVEDPTMALNHIFDNDEVGGLFNSSEPSVGNSYIETFVVDGWGGAKIDVTLVPDFPEGPPEMSVLASFNTDPGPATDYEGFETGWE